MKTIVKYYVDGSGVYLGGFGTLTKTNAAGEEITFSPEIPEGAIEVPTPPEHAEAQIWSEGAWVKNPDYREPIPDVSSAQALLALDASGLLPAVEAVVAAHPVPAVRIWYARANTWEWDNPYIQALAAELGLNDDAVETLFHVASLK